MKFFVVVFMMLFFAQAGIGQLHEDVLPNEQGTTLLDDLEANYKPLNVLTYKDARNLMFGEIDNVNDSVYCVYTHDRIYLNPNNSDHKGEAYNKGFNTEHTFPQSLGATGNAKSDLHHLFPTRVDVNGDRGHLPFAEVPDNITDNWYYLSSEIHSIPPANVIDEYSELDLNNSFEPREDHKGNVARAIMYFYTMYHDQASASFFQGMIPTLCAWHYEDAVNQREWDRTWAIADVQSGKPNPFVLDCTLPERSYCSGMGYMCHPDGTNEAKIITLFDVMPNPVRLAAKIRFTLESGSSTGNLVVHDMLGHVLESRKLNQLAAGPNELFLDVSSWEEGVYLYTVQVDGAVASGKLVVFR
ncbi:MAG TPA: T9SS type A sorting domain-containing protein [Saprospiraceae bacterium]|nr:T9SS type A sorting domain-containing protein [Saprospiraceae bacterium]